MDRNYYVYIVASARNGTIYTGVTNDLNRRAYEHRESSISGFTQKYGCKTLVGTSNIATFPRRSSARSGSKNGVELGSSN
jgi:predicted GIY-YIG superfamily endonuclease